MQLYLEIDPLDGGKIRVNVKVDVDSIKVTIRKHIFMRVDLTPFVYDIQKNFLTVYAKGVGEISIDQTSTQNDSYIILKVNGVDATDNNDVYNKLEQL
jgi:hypothetical protein